MIVENVVNNGGHKHQPGQGVAHYREAEREHFRRGVKRRVYEQGEDILLLESAAVVVGAGDNTAIVVALEN